MRAGSFSLFGIFLFTGGENSCHQILATRVFEGGSEYFLFPSGSRGEDNVFVKIRNTPKPIHKTDARASNATIKASDLLTRSKCPIKPKSSSAKTTAMRPADSMSGSFDCDKRRSQSAGSIYCQNRKREIYNRTEMSTQRSPVASYIHQVDSGRGSRSVN